MTYDKNGNLVYDYDRKIATIRYNILNLPDTIQFTTGNQIINRYAADGRKLKTDYYTYLVPLAVPLDPGKVITNPAYVANVVNLSGTSYVDNAEYTRRSDGLTYANGPRVYNSEGYTTGDGITVYSYYHKDHLGNNREVWDPNNIGTGNIIQRTEYYPSGLPWSEGSGESLQPRKYNGKEFIEMNGLDETDLGARGLHHAKFRFDGFDPLAEKHYDTSPYAVCSNNPVNRVDPDGMDWIYSNDDKKYSWRDDINAKSKMPKGYQYVGAKDNDILTHMGVSNKYETKTDNNTGIGAVGGDNKGPAGEGVPGTTSSDVKVDIRIDTNVSDNKKNITDNNKSGKTFNGVTVTAYVSERNASSSDDLASTSYGVFSVENVGIEYTKGLGKATGFIKSGTKATNSSIKIPASEITPTNYLRSATVTIGSPNAGVIYSSPTTITFNLQTRTYFRPSNK
jgi:RHS repeat-associated protein